MHLPEPSHAPHQVSRAPEEASLPARVLVIDDETAIRTALRRFFSRRGWEVEEAADGGEGLRLLLDPERSAAYAAVVCDLKMPGISGAELYERLREARPELLRRLIFSTGDVASPEASALLERARVPVVEKPFELAALAEVVERVRAEG
ncbi:MAG TPA: response regulator [Longimicrobiaceae bacterium]